MEVPKSWGLKKKPRKDGKVDLVGKDATGREYVARTTEQNGVTERDLQILSVGNRETSSPDKFVEFYANERRQYKKNWEASMDDEYMAGAEQIVHAGLHMSESRVGCFLGSARNNFDKWMESLRSN